MDPRINECHLVNEPGGDSGLYIELIRPPRAYLFDCGDLSNLSARKRLRAQDVFITHAHMDHFIGFDQLYRSALGLDHEIRLFGPPEIAQRIHHRLLGYTWNLIQPPDVHFVVREAHGEEVRQFEIRPDDQYQRLHPVSTTPHQDVDDVHVQWMPLDHTTPSFGYALVLPARWHVDAEKLAQAGYRVGPWVGELLKRLKSPDVSKTSTINTLTLSGDKQVPLQALAEAFLSRSPPCRIAYVTDTLYTPEVEQKVAQLAGNADLFFCEAVFLDEDQDRANRTHHLTTTQCGKLASAAHVKRLKTFHHSRRYQDSEVVLEQVRRVFPDAE